MVARAVEQFRRAFGRQEPAFVVRAPGRVDLLGAHTDYNDGWVMPVAIDRAAYLAGRACPSQLVTIAALDLDSVITFRLTELEERIDAAGKPLPSWATYAAGVAWALRKRGLAVSGLEAVLTADVPVGAGLSSSAAVEVALASAWQHLGGWALEPMCLALACQQAENEYVGVQCGLMDQFASVHGRAGHVLCLDCRTLEWEALPLPVEAAVVIADTKVRRELGDSEYNKRRAACEQAVRILQGPLPHIRALRDVSAGDFAQYARLLPQPVRQRAQHVVEETARTREAAAHLQRGDLISFGRAMSASHRSARDLYEVSIRELDVMASTAQRLAGCYGARLAGAGFGGCVVSLVARDATDAFCADLARRYQAETGKSPDIYVCQPAAGAGVLTID